MNKKVTHDLTFNGWSIHTTKTSGCYEDILTTIQSLQCYMLKRFSRVLWIRLDVTFPAICFYPDENDLFTGMMANLIKNLKRQGLSPCYVWCREQGQSHNPHYHLFLMLDGSKIRSPYIVFEKTRELWASALNIHNEAGLIDECRRKNDEGLGNAIMLDRNDPNYQQLVDYAFYRASYLAKEKTKGNSPYKVREFGSSQIPKQ
jgi:hypothetical protein